jgi:hypothetical protein
MKSIVYLVLCVAIFTGCANFVAPTGGLQDKNPPNLIFSEPKSGTTNFKGKELTLTFDELIDASAIHKELFIIPDPQSPFESKVKNNVLSLKFEKNLRDSTTYTFNFRNTVKDLTEKNPSKNLKLVLSTYNKIDSLKLTGKVISHYNKLPILDATVGLYPADTLPLLKKRPLYFVKTDSSGNYKIENVKDGKYFLLTFDDKNDNLRYDQTTENIGFLRDSVNIVKDTVIAPIEIYRADFSKNKIRRVLSREKEFEILLDKNPLGIEVLYENEADSNALSYTYKNSKIIFSKLTDSQLDTVNTTLIIKDSLQTIDTLYQKVYFREPSTRKRKIDVLNITSDIKNNQEITPNLVYNLYFDKPIVRFDTSKIVFTTDTSTSENLNIDKINNYHYKLSIDTKAENKVELFIPSNTFENFIGDTSNVFKLSNTILSYDKLGLIEGDVEDKEVQKIAILKNTDTGLEIERQTFIDKFLFEKIIPGTYDILIIFDENKNGIWDPGNIDNLTLPEKMLITEYPLRVRANYELRNTRIK